MKEIDLGQRLEEIELALSALFESPKAPAVSSYDDGTTFFIQASWVTESHADTTLDSRCVLTVQFSTPQMHRYALLDTAQRIVVRERLCKMVRERLPAGQNQPPLDGECSAEMHVDDSLLAFDGPVDSY